MAGTFIRGVKLVVDHGSKTVTVARPDGSPSSWETELHVNHGSQTVEVKMRGSTAAMKCLTGVGNYSEQPGSTGVDFFDDIDASRVGQRIWLDPWLPSTDVHYYNVTLASYSGDARTLTLGHYNIGPEAGFNNRVSRVEVFLKEGSVEVAPTVGATYVFDVLFWQTS